MSVEKIKEQLKKKSLVELEALIHEYKRKMGQEKDLATIGRLSSELSAVQELHDQKLRESGRTVHKSTTSSAKPDLKSYDDYVKSKK